MPRGGKREGAGRKPGSVSAATARRKEIADKAMADGVTPLEVMLTSMRKAWDDGDVPMAVSIAKDAAPYIHPKLSSVEASVDVSGHEAALDFLDG